MIFEPVIPWWTLLIVQVIVVVCLVLVLRTMSPQARKRWRARLGVMALLFVLLWRPQINIAAVQERSTLMDVYLVVDVTQSMVAEDYNGSKTRIEGVQADVEVLLKQLSGARFSVITFNNHANVSLGLTTDTSAVKSSVASVPLVQYVYANGSTISEPLGLLKDSLQKGLKSRPDRLRIVFYFGDGEQTTKDQPERFSSIKQYINGGGVLGYGTASGGPMKEIRSYTDKVEYIPVPGTYNSEKALSRIDETNLKTMAADMGVEYFHRETPTSGAELTSSLNAGGMAKAESDGVTPGTYDLAWIIAGLTIFALYYDYLITVRSYRRYDTKKNLAKGNK